MKAFLIHGRGALSITAALLAGCGGSQPPFGAAGRHAPESPPIALHNPIAAQNTAAAWRSSSTRINGTRQAKRSSIVSEARRPTAVYPRADAYRRARYALW